MPLVPATPLVLAELLDHELTLLVTRLRDFSPTRYAAPTPPFPSRAAALRHLTVYLVRAAGVDRQLPTLSDMALADIVAVTGHDLCATELTEAGAAAALAEVLLHRYDVDASLPGRPAAEAVLRVLDPAAEPSPRQVLVAARARCSVYQGAVPFRRPAR